MKKVKGYYGKVVEQGENYIAFDSGEQHFTLDELENLVGKFVMVDTHGNWWVKQ